MRNYILRRLLIAVPTALGVSLLIFATLRILPGDVLAAMFGEGEGVQKIDEAGRQKLVADLGLDRPLVVQYGSWLWGVARGDFGESFWRGESIGKVILRRGPVSAEIAILSVILSWIIGLPVGTLSALRRNTLADNASRVMVTLFLATPAFWLGALAILMLVVVWHWVPPREYSWPWQNPVQNFQMVFGPALVLGLGQAAMIARMARSSMLEVLGEDYVRTARAKGLRESVVVWRHAVKNAIIPVLTISGLALAYLIGGSVAVERAFGVPGLGNALVDAITSRDFNVIQNLVLIYAIALIIINLMTDLLYGWADPRVKYQ